MPPDDIVSIIEHTVRQSFGEAAIKAVRVGLERDHDGDAVFRVTVVFDGNKPLDAQKTAGIVRQTRKALIDREEYTFPIFAFVSKTEADSEPAAA